MHQEESNSTTKDEFVSLFSQHSRRIYSFIIALVISPQDADEVFQNTSLALWKKVDTFTPGTSFWAWACQVAYYEVLRLRKTKQRRGIYSDDALHQVAANLLAREEQISLREVSLRNCLDRLDARDRDMVELRYFHEKRPKQIAELQSRSVHSIYRALSRIHEKLHRCIQNKLVKGGD